MYKNFLTKDQIIKNLKKELVTKVRELNRQIKELEEYNAATIEKYEREASESVRLRALQAEVRYFWKIDNIDAMEKALFAEPMNMTTINMLSKKLVELLGEPFESV